MQEKLDRRLYAVRPDLADARLKGRVTAETFVEGERAMVGRPVCDLRPRPDLASGIDTQLLLGEPVLVFERQSEWAWVQSERDGYVGYLRAEALTAPREASHRVTALRSYVYSGPDLRHPILDCLSIGSRITVTGTAETRGTAYVALASGGFMVARHVSAINEHAVDYVTIAERFIETPYLWGGKSGFGLDCSGLAQLSMAEAGFAFPRDTDLQFASFAGTEPLARTALRRGDLVFWKGHVGIMQDKDRLLHANGHTMTVASEPLDGAIERIGWLYDRPTGAFRPPAAEALALP